MGGNRSGSGAARTKPANRVPFDIDAALIAVRHAVDPYPKAALFELAGDGFDNVFQQVVACLISVRTRDEVTLPTARRLFAAASTPADIACLGVDEIDRLIGTSSFHEAKARQILEIARRAEEEFGGSLPCDESILRSFSGVGPKCANLALGIACGQARISVDVHVHRVTNRWGYVHERTPEQTMAALEATLPERYWVEINRLLVPFGKHVCTGQLPRCSSCPVLDMCEQVGVAAHR
ncbi:MAG TPA: endonuclease III [Thermomicrobiaceae bacterium]|nr:endonuclease III [Thermomicrobiaceae bacterium]